MIDPREYAVALNLDVEELHLLVSWGYAIRELSGESFSESERALLAKLKAFRDEGLVL